MVKSENIHTSNITPSEHGLFRDIYAYTVLVRVTIAMMKHHDENQVVGERVYFFLYFQVTVNIW